MKKTIGICLFAAIALTVVFMLFTQIESSEARKPEDTQKLQTAQETEQRKEEPGEMPEITESMTVQEPYEYILKETDGVLVVYERDGTTILLETSIKVSNLDPDTQALLQEGVLIRDERELYDLLESYSS